MFSTYGLDDIERSRFRELGRHLGTYWTKEAVDKMFNNESGGEQLDAATTPLAMMLCQGNFQEYVQGLFGSPMGIKPPDWYRNTPRTEVVEMFNTPRAKFQQMSSVFTGFIPKEKV